MAGTPVDVGTGSIIAFGTSAFTSELLNVDWGTIERPAIETTHMGTAAPGAGKIGNATFIPGDITNPGEIVVEVHFDPDKTPPINPSDVAEVITITWPKVPADASAAKWEGQGFVKSFDISDPLEDKMTATITIQMTGNVTLTAAA